ncbi:MAG: hypothetical protein AAGA30_14175 [Planctomycetota bacterium]
MRFYFLATLAFCACSLCFGDFADAQRGGFGGRGFGGRGGGNNWMGLLRMESIQNEIELVDDQMEEIEGLQEEMWQEMQESMRGMRDLAPEERREQFAELREQMEVRQKDYQKQIEDVLLPMQVKRLKELHIQSQARRSGNGAVGVLQNENMLEELGIDDDQREKLEKKIEEVRKEIEEKIKDIRKEAEEDILSVLTSEQRKMFRAKVGETFDFGGDRDPGFRRERGGDRGERGRGGRGGRRGRPDRDDSDA